MNIYSNNNLLDFVDIDQYDHITNLNDLITKYASYKKEYIICKNKLRILYNDNYDNETSFDKEKDIILIENKLENNIKHCTFLYYKIIHFNNSQSPNNSVTHSSY